MFGFISELTNVSLSEGNGDHTETINHFLFEWVSELRNFVRTIPSKIAKHPFSQSQRTTSLLLGSENESYFIFRHISRFLFDDTIRHTLYFIKIQNVTLPDKKSLYQKNNETPSVQCKRHSQNSLPGLINSLICVESLEKCINKLLVCAYGKHLLLFLQKKKNDVEIGILVLWIFPTVRRCCICSPQLICVFS